MKVLVLLETFDMLLLFWEFVRQGEILVRDVSGMDGNGGRGNEVCFPVSTVV